MVESPEQTAVELESSQGDKTGYCAHNQGERLRWGGGQMICASFRKIAKKAEP